MKAAGQRAAAHGLDACIEIGREFQNLAELSFGADSIFRLPVCLGYSLETIQMEQRYNAARNIYLVQPEDWALDALEQGAENDDAIYGFHAASLVTRLGVLEDVDMYIEDFRMFGYTLWDRERWEACQRLGFGHQDEDETNEEVTNDLEEEMM